MGASSTSTSTSAPSPATRPSYSASRRALPAPPAAPPLPSRCATDVPLLAILVGPLRPGETALVGFARKEHELRVAFAALSPLASRALCTRLEACRPDDALALAFARLTVERRVRLLTYLGSARRREALAATSAARRA